MSERGAFPGGYNKNKRIYKGRCSACGEEPIKKGNRFLCSRCFHDNWDCDKVTQEEEIVSREEALEISIRVETFCLVPPTPIKHLSCDDYTQAELQAYLDGGAR